MEELTTAPSNISEDAAQLMKFHGSYQQDDREKRGAGKGKAYQFMMRTRQPAGRVSNRLYLTMDDLADHVGNGTLRLTTRQAYQLHGERFCFCFFFRFFISFLSFLSAVIKRQQAQVLPFPKPKKKNKKKLTRFVPDPPL